MVKLITWVRLIYDFMVASFVQITHFLRYILECSWYVSLVNKGNLSYTKLKHDIYTLSVVKHNYCDV